MRKTYGYIDREDLVPVVLWHIDYVLPSKLNINLNVGFFKIHRLCVLQSINLNSLSSELIVSKVTNSDDRWDEEKNFIDKDFIFMWTRKNLHESNLIRERQTYLTQPTTNQLTTSQDNLTNVTTVHFHVDHQGGKIKTYTAGVRVTRSRLEFSLGLRCLLYTLSLFFSKFFLRKVTGIHKDLCPRWQK